MYATFDREELKLALAKVKPIIDTRGIIPALSMVKISGDGTNKCSVSAFNMDTGIKVDVQCKPETDSDGNVKPFSAVLHFPTMEALLARKKTSAVSVSAGMGDDTVIVNSFDASGIKFNTASVESLPLADMPKPDVTEAKFAFRLNNEIFQKILQSIKFAISKEETRFYLNGIYFDVPSSEAVERLKPSYIKSKEAIDPIWNAAIRMTATNGHVLATDAMTAQCVMGETGELTRGWIVRLETIEQVIKLFKGTDITFLANDDWGCFIGDGVKVVAKHIDGTYPDFESVIPDSPKNGCKFQIKDLLESCKSLEKIGKAARPLPRRPGPRPAASDTAKFALSPSTGESEIVVGEVEETINVADYEINAEQYDDDVRWRFDFSTNLLIETLDALNQTKDSNAKVSVRWIDPASPFVFRSDSEIGPFCVVMPKRVGND